MVIRTTTWLSLALACSGALTSAHAQQPAEPIADLLVDADEDFLVDRLDQRARIRGVVTAAPYTARRDREVRIYVEDASAGIRCIATDHGILAGIRPGDLVTAAGVIEHYRGMEQLHLKSLERVGQRAVPDPMEANVGAVAAEPLLGRLVTITAQLTPPVLDACAKLVDATGTVELYLPGRFLDDPQLIQKLSKGGGCTVIGYAEQNDATSPYDSGYRLRLRSPQDLTLTQPTPVTAIVVAATTLLFGAGMIILFLRRRRAMPQTPPASPATVDRVQGQKMEALGTLAGGIAHEFNNYLAAIRGYTELASADLESTSETRKYLDEVLATSDKAKELIDKILKFGRKTEPTMEVVDIADVVAESLSLIRAAVPANVELESRIDPFAGAVRAATNQLHQVMLNLASNSVDAMRGPGGTVRVEVDRVRVDEDLAAELQLAASGYCARIAVTDNGPGMDEKTLARMYDPFFTTKDVGLGTGLGLSIVHSILAAHQAGTRVTSKVNAGTAFEIFLPVTSADESALPKPAGTPDAPSGSKRVLIVDDTESLARLGRRQLKALGYDAQIATSGAQALEDFAAADPPIDAVVTDYRMPGISGLELAERLQQLQPGLAVLMVTGYGHLLSEEQAAAAGVREVIKKPYARDDLGRALRAALDGA